MNKIVKKVFNIFLIILIGVISIYAILKMTNRIEIFKVKTGSMEDNIHTGDYILLVKQRDYEVGDVVTFKVNDYHVTHRIIKENGDRIITKGDANNIEDDEISKQDIIGKVIFSGGILNFIIMYKYVLIGVLVIVYLITCYFDNPEEEKTNTNNKKINIKKTNNKNTKIKK